MNYRITINLEAVKFSLLSLMFFLIIGVYWFLRPIKDGVFITMLGAEYLPYVKILSVLIIFPVIAFYGHIVDRFSRDKVFYIMTSVFGLLAIFFALMLNHPIYGVYSSEPSLIKAVIGISLSIYVKIFGSVMVAMFWSFVSDTTTPESAKNWYSLISIGGQLGNVLGPLFVGLFASYFGIVKLAFIAGVAMFMLFPIMFYFTKIVPKELLSGFHGKNENSVNHNKLGLFGGFKFLISNPYLMSIYATISIFEVVQAILDFRFKMLVGNVYTGDELVAFLGKFGALTGACAIFCLLWGKTLSKKITLKLALLILPVALIFLVTINLYTSLYVSMWVLVFARAINYALNQPSKEQLYITTSKEAKYKAKAWIEIFGTRTSEAFAQSVNMLKNSFGVYFMPVATGISLSLLSIWLLLTVFQSYKYEKSVKDNEFIC